MFKWESGRSGGGYEKLTLFDCRWPMRWDMHLLRLKEGSCVHAHRDPVPEGFNHWRCNIVLYKADEGGDFECEDALISLARLKVFRPDRNTHCVTEVRRGTRVCLSIGWLTKGG